MLGSRCVKHWVRRQQPYRELPTKEEWWRAIEPVLIAGLELRVMVLREGGSPEATAPILSDKKTGRWQPLITKIIDAADGVVRRHREEHRSGTEAAQG